MALVSDLIIEAFLDMGAIAPGELPTTAEQSDAFLRLNQMIKSWAIEKLTIPQYAHTSFTPTAGITAYTLGTGGSFATAARPIRVTGATSVSGNFRSAVEVMSFEKFGATVADPMGSSAVLALKLAADGAYPSINLRVFPVPAPGPGSLLIDYWTALAAFATVGDTVNLSEGIEDALHFNLAIALYPQYARAGGIDPVLASNAQNSKAALVALNADILGLTPPPAQGRP